MAVALIIGVCSCRSRDKQEGTDAGLEPDSNGPVDAAKEADDAGDASGGHQTVVTRVNDKGFKFVRTGTAEGVIVPAPAGGSSERYWTPTLYAVASFEAGVDEHLRRTVRWRDTQSREHPCGELCERIRSYKRQYTGYLKGKRKLLGVLLSCRTSERWGKVGLAVHGGGDCTVYVVYDVDAAKYDTPTVG
jgi:hypothetical protein